MSKNDYNIGEFDYLNHYNYNDKRPSAEWGKETPEGESMTVPGESMTVREIMDRALSGMPMEQSEYPYFDQEDIDNIFDKPIDLTDLDASRRHIEEMQESVEEAIALRDQEDSQLDEEPELEEPPVEPTA